MSHRLWHRFGTITATVLVASTLHIVPPTSVSPVQLRWEETAEAGRSGGRSSGGSFRNPSRSTPSRSQPSDSGGSSNPSRSTSPNNSNRTDDSGHYRGGSGGSVIVVPGGGSSYRSYGSTTYSSGSDWFTVIMVLLILGLSIGSIVWFAYYFWRSSKSASASTGNKEIDNNIVTVSQIQVALLAEARQLQTDLTELSLQVDTDTPEGLQELLQETVLALLRSPENWSHVLASSQTVKSRDEAEQLFNQLSVTERSKFSVETLTNVGGRVSRRELKIDPNQDPAAYIVVTLLVGTAHDKPLFPSIRTTTELQQALQTLAAMPTDYLLVFELQWTPQDSSDSLSYDELLTQYTNMVQI